MSVKIQTLLILASLSFHVAGTASADVISEAAKIGANAGAMNYCKDKIASDDDKSKYSLLSIKTMGEYKDLDSNDRVKALVYRKAAEDGDYLGDPLTEERCDSLRKTLFIKYK
jgi:hypothetical protein